MKASLPSWLSGVLVLILVPFFFIGGPDYFAPQLIKTLWDFGHIIFFTLALLLVQAFVSLSHWRQWLWVTVLALVASGAIETVQYFVGRDASWEDALHNLFGVWLGLFWGQKPTRRIWILRAISVLCVLPALWGVVDAAWAEVVMRKQFPKINHFESRHELQQVRSNPLSATTWPSTAVASQGSTSLGVRLSTEKFAGINLFGTYGDWNGYQFLNMDFYNPDTEPLELVIKISDYRHDIGRNRYNDRFNRPIILMTGWNNVRIALEEIRTAPAGRGMQMDKITGLAVFARQLSQSREFYWDNIYLE